MGKKSSSQQAVKPKPGLFSSAKGKLTIVIAFVAGLATFLGNLTSIKNFFNLKPERFSIKGVVINSNNTPIEQGKVSLYVWSNKFIDSFSTFSDQSGTFDFPNLLKKKYDSLRLEAFWKSKHVSYENKFNGSYNDHILLTLPTIFKSANENPLVYHFYWLKGHTIDYLLQGKIDSSWIPQLSGHPYIIENGVFQALSFLKSQFSEPNEYPELTGNFKKIENGKKKFGQITTRHAPANLLAGTIKYDDPDIIGVMNDAQITMDEKDMTGLIGERLVKKLLANSGESSHLILTKKQFDRVVEINGHYDDSTKLINLFSFITKNNYPDDFIEADVAYNECGGGFTLQLFPPALSLKVVLIENKDKSKIYSLGDFNLVENSDTVLRALYSPKSSAKTVRKNYFPIIKMTSDDRILIPLKILFETYQGEWFEYGPTDSLVSQAIDEDEYIARIEPQKEIYTFDSHQGGSCPYIFTRNVTDATWQKENHILYGFHNKSKESEQTLRLTRFDGSLQIRELDPEISYIDELYIRTVLSNGSTEIIRANNRPLRYRDSNYLIMHKGEKLQVNFDKKIDKKGIIEVVAYGYYIRNRRR